MTLQDITVKDLGPRTIAYLNCKGSWRQLPEMLARLGEWMSRSGLKAAGPASGIYYNTPKQVNVQDLVWEVFYPVSSRISELREGQGDFGVRQIPGSRMTTIIHEGSYRKAGLSYEHLEEWIKREGHEVCVPAEEVYLTDIMSPDEEQTIEIRLPVSSV